jgi:RNA polymerase sigma-70 factor (ECF subfamily)
MTIGEGGDDHDVRFEAIYRKHYGQMYRFFRSAGVADGEAHDLAQDTFQRFYEHMHQYRGEGDSSYLQTIARNVLLNWIRAGKAAKRSGNMVDIDDPDVSEQLAAPEEADYAERQHKARRRTAVVTAIAKLPAGQRECLRLWVQGRKYNDIASILGVSIDAVKSRLRDAKKQLRATLADEHGGFGPGSLPEE